MKRFGTGAAIALLTASTLFCIREAWAQKIPSGWLAKNVQVIGYTEENLPSAFKLTVTQRRGNWYLILGHYIQRGWTVVDVTDPAKPQWKKFVRGPDNTYTFAVDLAENKLIAGLAKPNVSDHGDPNKPNEAGFMIWDVTDPLNWVKLGQYTTEGGLGTHRNGYQGGRYVHLAAFLPGYEGAIYVIVDINDPAHPVEAGRWWVPGQHTAGGEKSPVRFNLHGPPVIVGNLAYLPYGAAMVILDISNVQQPKLVGRLDFVPPFHEGLAVHSVVPIPERNIALVTSENTSESCKAAADQTSIVDISNPAKPWLISLFPRPIPPPGLPYTNFCDKHGRFGPHNFHQLFHNPDVQKPGDLAYLTYFNAGLRIFNIRDARQPVEVGWFIPPNPRKRYHSDPKEALVTSTEDVVVDARGYIYITDKNQGVWILKYAGEGAAQK